jgi:hypothetical protein
MAKLLIVIIKVSVQNCRMVQEGSCLYPTSESYERWCSWCTAGSSIDLIFYLVSSLNLIIYMGKELKTWELKKSNGCYQCCCLSQFDEEHIPSRWKVFVTLYVYYIFGSIMVGQCLKRRVYCNRCHCTVILHCWMFTVEVFVNLAKILYFIVSTQLSLVHLGRMCLQVLLCVHL